MTALDDEIGPEVVAILEEFGIPATLVSTHRTPDPASAGAHVADASHAITITPPQTAKEWVEGETAERRHLEALVAGLGIAAVPKAGDFVRIGTVRYSVVSVGEISSGAAVAAYSMRLERG